MLNSSMIAEAAEHEYEMKATDAMGDLLEDSHYFENDGANWGFD